MDLKSLKASGVNLTAGQQAAFYYARKRRRERENASASEIRIKDGVVGIRIVVVLTTA